jgi:hypothetical protein
VEEFTLRPPFFSFTVTGVTLLAAGAEREVIRAVGGNSILSELLNKRRNQGSSDAVIIEVTRLVCWNIDANIMDVPGFELSRNRE